MRSARRESTSWECGGMQWEDGRMRVNPWEDGRMGGWEDGSMGAWEDEGMRGWGHSWKRQSQVRGWRGVRWGELGWGAVIACTSAGWQAVIHNG